MAERHLNAIHERVDRSMSNSPANVQQPEQEKGPVFGEEDSSSDQPLYNYPQGALFWLLSACIALMMFMVNLEIPVVTTALVAITNDLGGLEDAGWAVSGYLVGYVCMLLHCSLESLLYTNVLSSRQRYQRQVQRHI
jgi:hypothetical protein